MADSRALALLSWVSPAYPVGAFAYSHGLEMAIDQGDVRDLDTLLDWIAIILRDGSGHNDAVLFAAAWRLCRGAPRAADRLQAPTLSTLADLAVALAPCRERRLETVQQGGAFLAATRAAWPHEALEACAAAIGEATAYPVVFAAAAAAHEMDVVVALEAYLHAFGANLVSAAVRLSVIGQTQGQQAGARLAPISQEVARRAAAGSLDDLGGCAFRADLAAFRHETLYSRLFRS